MVRSFFIAAVSLFSLSPAFALPVAKAGDVTYWSGLVMSQEAEEREPGPADLEEAIEIALKRYGGRATRSETVVRDGRTVHEVRLLADDGIVRTVRIDPETGAIIPQQR
jgi:hypothetical protein